MTTNRTEKGETARRIYAVLHRNPGLSSAEIMERLSDLTYAAISSALYKMKKRGAIEARGTKRLPREGNGRKTTPLYHVKYKSNAVPKPKKKAPERVRAPRVHWVDLQPKSKKVEVLGTVEVPKVDAELVRVLSAGKSKQPEPMPPVSSRFTEAYERLAMLHSETLLELNETKEQLAHTQNELMLADKAIENHSCWWCSLKKVFS